MQQNEKKKISVIEKFEMNAVNDNPIYEVWLSNSDDTGLRFIEFFEKFHLLFNGEALMIPRYYHWNCETCSSEILNASCVCNGLYCGMHDYTTFNGYEVIMEDLRQKCVFLNSKFNSSEHLWWDYMAVH